MNGTRQGNHHQINSLGNITIGGDNYLISNETTNRSESMQAPAGCECFRPRPFSSPYTSIIRRPPVIDRPANYSHSTHILSAEQ